MRQKSIAGKTTGSLFNYLMGNNESIPEVGKGATQLLWSDRHAYEVLSVSEDKTKVTIQRYAPTRLDKLGMSDQQCYEYVELVGSPIEVVWYRNAWRIKSKSVVFTKEFDQQKEAETGKVYWSLTKEEREELYQGKDSLQVVEGKTRIKTEYHTINILWGTKEEYYDYSF